MENTMKQALALVHLRFEDCGNLEPVLLAQGYQLQYLHVGVDAIDKTMIADADLVIVLGGPIGLNDIDDYPYLAAEVECIKARISNDSPTLGICLGAQIIAFALGEKVYSSNKKEIGWATLSQQQENIFTNIINAEARVLHWHGETFDLPEQAELLASTDVCPNQAFKVANNILALQFHLEVPPEKIEEWLIGHYGELKANNIDIQKIREDAKIHGQILQPHAKQFWHTWLEKLN